MLGWFLSKTNSTAAGWISYISVLIVSVLFSVFYLQSFFFLTTILLISLPVLSYNIASGLIKKLTLSMELSADHLTLIFYNPSFIPVSCADITLDLYSKFYGGYESETHSLSIRAHGETCLNFPLTIKKYGIYEALMGDLIIYDHLHLFTFGKQTNIRQSVTLMPEISPIEKRIEITYDEGFDEFTDTGRKGNASSNVTDIREYRPGDRLSRIHWKLTEKFDTLIVKENEATSSNDFIVLLELYQPPKEDCLKDPAIAMTLNNAIEEAYAIALELIGADEPFLFMFYNEKAADFVSMRTITREDLDAAMTAAFYAGSYTTKDLALSVYTRSGLNKGTLIHVN